MSNLIGKEATAKLVSGIQNLTNLVKVTLGPGGLNVVMANTPIPTVTKDGVSVARGINLPDYHENIAAKLIKQVASNAESEAGDGTTTSTLLANAMVKYGMQRIEEGLKPKKVMRELKSLVAAVHVELDIIKRACNTRDELFAVALISTDGDVDMSNLVADAVYATGTTGLVNINEGINNTDTLTLSKGYMIETGMFNPNLTTRRIGTPEAYYQSGGDCAQVLLLDGELNLEEPEFGTTVDFLTECIKLGYTNLTIIADDFSVSTSQWAQTMANPSSQGGDSRTPVIFNLVKSPSFSLQRRNLMQDIAALTSATILPANMTSKDSHVNITEVPNLVGHAKSITTVRKHTTIIPSETIDTTKYVEALKESLANIDNLYDKNNLSERLSRLSGGIANIYVGDITEARMKERKDRYDDAVRATSGALADGVVVGGGYALLTAALSLEGTAGTEILRVPFTQILLNDSYDQDEVDEYIEVFENDTLYLDMSDDVTVTEANYPVVDPVKVTHTALDTAFSIASLVITTGAIVAPEVPVTLNGQSMGFLNK